MISRGSELTIELLPGGMNFAGRNWLGELAPDEFRSVLPSPERAECLCSGGRPWRTILYYDSFGVYALEDIEEKRIVYVGVALIPSATPFPTRDPFSGKLMFNGCRVFPGMKSRELPLRGALNFVKGIGPTWKYVHDNGYVELNLKAVASRHQTRSGEPILVSVTHSFLKE